MSICTDIFYNSLLRPRRIRRPECSAYTEQERWVNFIYATNLTADPQDNDPASGLGAWTLGDLPVTHAWQDVSDRGDDRCFVVIGDRVYTLDWERFRDEWNWETFYPIYRQLTLGPIPGSKEEQEGGAYNLQGLKRFRRLSYQMTTAPTDPDSQYKISVNDDGSTGDPAVGFRTTQREGVVQIAKKGYSFLVTLEHEANEDFPLSWWQADWEELGYRRANDPIVTT